jgi:hypothetical protein
MAGGKAQAPAALIHQVGRRNHAEGRQQRHAVGEDAALGQRHHDAALRRILGVGLRDGTIEGLGHGWRL